LVIFVSTVLTTLNDIARVGSLFFLILYKILKKLLCVNWGSYHVVEVVWCDSDNVTCHCWDKVSCEKSQFSSSNCYFVSI